MKAFAALSVIGFSLMVSPRLGKGESAAKRDGFTDQTSHDVPLRIIGATRARVPVRHALGTVAGLARIVVVALHDRALVALT